MTRVIVGPSDRPSAAGLRTGDPPGDGAGRQCEQQGDSPRRHSRTRSRGRPRVGLNSGAVDDVRSGERDTRFADIAKPRARVLVETSSQQPRDVWRNVWMDVPVRLVARDGRECIGDRLTRERGSPRQHLVQHAPERPDVGALDRPARPRACSGDMYAAVPRIMPACVIAGVVSVGDCDTFGDDARGRFHRLREAEVEHLHGAVWRAP